MRPFREFITEKKKDLPGGNPSNIPPGDIEALQRQAATGRRERLSTDDITQSGRRIKKRGGPSRVVPTPEGPLLTNMPQGKTSPEEIVSRLTDKPTPDDKIRQQVRDTVAKNPTSSPELQRAQSSGPPEEMVGSSKKPRTKPGSYEVDTSLSKTEIARRQRVATQGSGLLKSIRGGRETTARMGRAYSKNLAVTGDAIIKSIGDERRAETVAGNKEFKQQRYGRGRSGPSSPLRTPAQVAKFEQGIEKGYFDPKTNKLTSAGIQKYTDSRAAAGPNFGKGDPRAALAKVQNIVPRAVSGDKAARAEIRRTYKAATTGYKPPQGTPPAPSKATPPPSQVIAQTQQTGRIETSKLASTPSTAPKGGGSSGPSKSGGGVLTPEKVKTTLSGPLKSGPAPSTPTKKPTAASFTPGKTKSGTGLYTPPAKPASVKPALVGASTNNAAKELEKVSGKVIRQMRADKTAAAVKAVKNLGRASTVLGTTLDFQSAFQKAKQSGAGQLRAIGAGTAAAGGGLAGAATGARLGGLVGGLPGSIVGGILGYTGGVKKAGQIYRGVVGKPGEQVTSQSVLKNIKKVYRQEVPTSIRQVVPKQVKKGFTDFYNQAVGAAKKVKKGYDSYTKAQQIKKEVTK